MLKINQSLEKYISEAFPGRKVVAYRKPHTWNSSRYLYVTTVLEKDEDIHYEYIKGYVELHLEGKYQSSDYEFAKKLRIETIHNRKLQWLSWGRSNCRCRLDFVINSYEKLKLAFEEIMDIFDSKIKDLNMQMCNVQEVKAYNGEKDFFENKSDDEEVYLATNQPLGKIFSNKLVIPDYQRNYCWEDKQINDLWNCLKDIPQNEKYHLGSIILQKKENGEYDIIDGQQRLVTLTLLVDCLNYSGEKPLLTQTFRSSTSKEHVANCKWLIDLLVKKCYDKTLCDRIINNLVFTVLILNKSHLDLAYTFFSNENSKGVPLTDFDLLKAHHLRYIFDENQAEHLAMRWNSLIEQDVSSLNRTLAVHLFRLRKWMRKRKFNPAAPFCVKEEFSSADITPGIPPFGERFDFYEKIQGGTHFFAYAENFVRKYKLFVNTRQVQSLNTYLRWKSHWKYADVIETLLFGYYLKFGEEYLTEALFCISVNIAQHRYESSHALMYKIREFASDSEIIMMIDQASSPTFFLAECISAVNKSGRDAGANIAIDFYYCLRDMFSELADNFSEMTVIERYKNEF